MACYHFPERNAERSTYERTLFPAPATVMRFVTHMEMIRAQNTDVSHGSIKTSSYRNTSTVGTYHHESTMFLFRYAEIHEQYYGSSTDLGGKANCEYFVPIRHLGGGSKPSAFLVSNGVIKE